ncbi:MAG: ComEA family DNA-binding protein [Synechococcales bacterium]|nr:ComEA family DNA-binding protein [Synechococcales bacterium]
MADRWWQVAFDRTVGKRRQEATLQAKLRDTPYYRFQSLEEVAIAARLGFAIDVNRATVDDWLRLPGISIHQARSLVQLTQSGVPLHSLEDLAAALGESVQNLRAIAPVLQFCYYAPESGVALEPVNPNTASVERLLRLPAVDLRLAQAIVAHRQQAPYRNLADFQARLQLSGALIADLMHYLRF